MNKWIASHGWVAILIGAAVSTVVFAFTTFATVEYVDKKHEEVKTWLSRVEDKLDRALER